MYTRITSMHMIPYVIGSCMQPCTTARERDVGQHYLVTDRHVQRTPESAPSLSSSLSAAVARCCRSFFRCCRCARFSAFSAAFCSFLLSFLSALLSAVLLLLPALLLASAAVATAASLSETICFCLLPGSSVEALRASACLPGAFAKLLASLHAPCMLVPLRCRLRPRADSSGTSGVSASGSVSTQRGCGVSVVLWHVLQVRCDSTVPAKSCCTRDVEEVASAQQPRLDSAKLHSTPPLRRNA